MDIQLINFLNSSARQGRISVILPFRNPGKDFTSSIQSVFAQTFTDWELLLMDDGSSDGSVEFAQTINDPRVRVFGDGLSLGLSRRLNQLIHLARTPYIARMDADDVMHPERLEKQYELLMNSAPNTVAGTSAYVIDSESRLLGIRKARSVQRMGFAATGSFIHPTVMASTEWFKEYGYSENPSFFRSEDVELWIRSSTDSRFVNIQEPLLYYRESVVPSIDKYAGSTLGSVVMGARIATESRLQALSVVSSKLLKLWLVCAADIMGHPNRLPHNRFSELCPPEAALATSVLRAIAKTPLPRLSQQNMKAKIPRQPQATCLA